MTPAATYLREKLRASVAEVTFDRARVAHDQHPTPDTARALRLANDTLRDSLAAVIGAAEAVVADTLKDGREGGRAA